MRQSNRRLGASRVTGPVTPAGEPPHETRGGDSWQERALDLGAACAVCGSREVRTDAVEQTAGSCSRSARAAITAGRSASREAARARARAVRVAARARCGRRSRTRRDTVWPCGSSSTRGRAASERPPRRPRRRPPRRSAAGACWSRPPTRRTASATCSASGSAPSRARSRRASHAASRSTRASRRERHWGPIRDYLGAAFRHQGIEDVGGGRARPAAGRRGADHAARRRAARATSGAYDLVVRRLRAHRRRAAPAHAARDGERVPAPACSASQRAARGRGDAARAEPRGGAAARLRGVPRRRGAPLPAPRARCARCSATPTTSVRLVVTPERMVIDEALRAHTDLALFEVGCDAVVMNRLLPDGAPRRALLPRLGPRCRPSGWPRSRRASRPLPVLRAPLRDDEVVGARARSPRTARALFGERAPDAVLCARSAAPLRARRRAPTRRRCRCPGATPARSTSRSSRASS